MWIWMTWWMKKFNYLCIWLKYTCVRISVPNFEVHILILEVVKVHWPDDECLSLWAWRSILKLIWFGVLPTLLKLIDHANNTHEHGNFLPPSFSGVLRASKRLWSIVSFKLKQNRMKLKKVELFTHETIMIVINKGKKDICLVDGQSTRVKCNPLQLHSLAKIVTNKAMQVANEKQPHAKRISYVGHTRSLFLSLHLHWLV